MARQCDKGTEALNEASLQRPASPPSIADVMPGQTKKKNIKHEGTLMKFRNLTCGHEIPSTSKAHSKWRSVTAIQSTRQHIEGHA